MVFVDFGYGGFVVYGDVVFVDVDVGVGVVVVDCIY